MTSSFIGEPLSVSYLANRKIRRFFAMAERLKNNSDEEGSSGPSVPNAEAIGSSNSTPQPAHGARIQTPHPHDVLCGRGRRFNLRHPGNKMFRKMILERKEEYCVSTERKVKAEIAQDILNQIASLQPPGRFLIKDENNPADKGKLLTNDDGDWMGCWIEATESWAFIKVSQALREGAPNLRLKAEKLSVMTNRKRPPEENNPFHESHETDSQTKDGCAKGQIKADIQKQNKPKAAKVAESNMEAEESLFVDEMSPEPFRGNESPQISDRLMLEFLEPLFSEKQPLQEEPSKPSSNLQNIYQPQTHGYVDYNAHYSPFSQQQNTMNIQKDSSNQQTRALQNQQAVLPFVQEQAFQQQNFGRNQFPHQSQIDNSVQPPGRSLLEAISHPPHQGKTPTADLSLGVGHSYESFGRLQTQKCFEQREIVPNDSQLDFNMMSQEMLSKEQQVSLIHSHEKMEDTSMEQEHQRSFSQSREEGRKLGKKCFSGLCAVNTECSCALGLDDDFVNPFDDY